MSWWCLSMDFFDSSFHSHFHCCPTVMLLPLPSPWWLRSRIPGHMYTTMFPGHDPLHAEWLATSVIPSTPGAGLSLPMVTDNVSDWLSSHCAQEPILLVGFMQETWLGSTPDSGGNLVPFSGAVGLVEPALISTATVCVVWVHILSLANSTVHFVYKYNPIFTKI